MALARFGEFARIFPGMHFVPDFSSPSRRAGCLSRPSLVGWRLPQLSASDQSRIDFGHSSCRLSALSSQLSALSCQLTALSSQLSALSCQLSAVRSQLTALSSQLSAVSSQLSALSSQLSAVSSQLSAHSSQLSAVSSQLAALSWQLSVGSSQLAASSLQLPVSLRLRRREWSVSSGQVASDSVLPGA
jgi:uncharacterized phage infection (PIP) family protein YhgE